MIQIVTDSTCDLGAQRAGELGVEVVPLTVNFGQESFLDGVELSVDAFYTRLENSGTLPTTSQIGPERFQEVFRRILDRGDDVLGVFLSSELSGTYQSACIAQGMLDAPGRIHLVDSRLVTIPMRLLVEELALLRDAGMDGPELAAQARQLAGRVRLLAALDTLKYLKMGGRISAATAVAGELLGITPLVGIVDGRVESIGKTRGRKAAFKWMREHIERAEPIDFSRCIGFGHGHCPQAMEQIMDFFAPEAARARCVVTAELGPAVGTYAGPGATGIVYFTTAAG